MADGTITPADDIEFISGSGTQSAVCGEVAESEVAEPVAATAELADTAEDD